MKNARAVGALFGQLAFLGLALSPVLNLKFVKVVHATLPTHCGSFPAALRHRLPYAATMPALSDGNVTQANLFGCRPPLGSALNLSPTKATALENERAYARTFSPNWRRVHG